MQNSFEESIKKQLASFEITPKKAVWDEIERSLDTDYNRKKAILIWLTLGLFIIGMSYIGYNYYLPNNKVVKSQNVLTTSITNCNHSITQNTLVSTAKKEKDTRPNTNGLALLVSTKSVTKCNKVIELNKGGVTLRLTKQQSIINQTNKLSIQVIKKKTQPFNQNNDLVKVNNKKMSFGVDKKKVSITVNKQTSESGMRTVERTDSVRQIFSSKINNPQKYSNVVANNDSNASKTNIDSSIIKHKSSRFCLMIGGGKINVPIKTSNNSLVASTMTGSGSYTSITDVMSNNLPTKSGIALKLGITYQLDITKRWQFETGLNYLFIQNNQPIGLQKDSSNLSDNGHYYQAGSNTFRNNYAHLLQVPLRLKYVLNPHSPLPFYVLLGGTVGYQLQSKWLVAENSNAILYYKKSLTKHLLSSGLIGFGLALKNKIGIDVTAEKALTALQFNTYNKNLVQIISLNLSIPTELILNSRKSKNK